MKDCVDLIKAYKLAGEDDTWRVPKVDEVFELSAGLGWIQHITKGEETKRVNIEFVVEIVWEEEKEGSTPLSSEEDQIIEEETSSTPEEGVVDI